MARFTREELYELVWSAPMSQLAPRFGLSDVALKKRCKKVGIPTPGLGYWAKVAAGLKPKRPPLGKPPKPGLIEHPWTDLSTAPPPEPQPPRPPAPVVVPPTTLRGAPDAVVALATVVKAATTDHHGLLCVPAAWGDPTFRVGPASKHRALLLLTGLVRALELRGHTVVFTAENEHGYGAPGGHLVANVGDDRVCVKISEATVKEPHVLTRKEAEERDRWGRTNTRKWDHVPSGRLRIDAGGCRHYDAPGRALEADLGEVVVSVELAALDARRRRLERERKELEERAHRRRVREREVRAEYEDKLVEDLLAMADRWHVADRVRRFVAAVENSVAADDRPAGLQAWLDWACAVAEQNDPLSEPTTIAKILEPDLSRLDEDPYVVSGRRSQ